MESLFKKVMYTGVGLVSTTAEKVQEKVNELVEKGNLSEEEGKKVVNDFITDFDTKKDELETRVSKIINKVINSFDFPSRNEVTNLKTRIAELEAQLEPAKKTVTRKTTAKKATASIKKTATQVKKTATTAVKKTTATARKKVAAVKATAKKTTSTKS